MELTTDSQREAAKLMLRATSQKPLLREMATKILTNPEYGAYDRNNDAKNFVKDAINDNEFPLEVQDGMIVRTDMEVA